MPEWNSKSSGGYPDTASSGTITTSAPDSIARLVRRGNDARGITLDVADDQIELRQ